jgi:hypothetical protein
MSTLSNPTARYSPSRDYRVTERKTQTAPSDDQCPNRASFVEDVWARLKAKKAAEKLMGRGR